ncbi:NADH dehydrogenase-like protein [Pirellulimonas nuda]|uniref:NADH:ubiquinone reductase (non-electrogenic) n=1 Tax=Pirellulimonas nuda TaxID=2528009 RepID=A0A518DI50_9BACT|nr:NAD(P)/FAD-dependent oxidoreductase [Pirellulimonas nuda]QDU91157.1 NADH dehydrogenase-like protein [Pirellulimonas nuda]
MSNTPRPKVVIIGGGFGGMAAAKKLRRVDVDVTLVDRRNFHLFQPLLYQVATGALSPANIAAPLRWIFRKQQNCDVVLGEVAGFDLDQKRVRLTDQELPYDILIVAAGSGTSYFGHDDWPALAPGLKTVEDATETRRRIFSAFEAAEREDDPDRRRAWLTFVLVGAGPTGVELAGALCEIARHSLKHDFRRINPAEARVLLIEAGPRVLPAFPEDLSAKAEQSLRRLGVTVRTGVMVTGIDEQGVDVRSGDQDERIEAHTVLWSAGVRAAPLADRLASAAGLEQDRGGRLAVEPDLTLPGRPEVLVIGDMASFKHDGPKPLPGVAPVAIEQGRHAAAQVKRFLRGEPLAPFKYRDPGSIATIGRAAAVAEVGRLRFSGFFAWLMWLFIHVMKITGFRNRLLVLMQWGWSYFTYDRSARLITGEDATDGQ